MLNQDDTDNQQAQLAAHRRRLAHLLRQQARLGDYTPPHVALDIEDARASIAQIKTDLRAAGVDVADHPDDAAGAVPRHLPALFEQARRNRSRMLQKVRDFWIKGVLEHPLHDAALIELGMEYRLAAIAHPWDMIIQQERDTRSLPSGTRISDVFDELAGELLILGAPGAGKTTLLLELARDLITRAEQDEAHPMPVVFNLSSWAEKRPLLAEWLVEELNVRYDVPRKIGKMWVEADVVLPLLDGLDEVKQEHRAACVEAINTFRHEHGLVYIVVCSRVADYEALTARLKLQGAILVQSLTPQQIDAYLERAGEQLAGLRAALAEDAALRELAKTPLILSVMALAYQRLPTSALLALGTADEQRKRLFDTYAERMFARRGVETRYSWGQTVRWLVWLARGMVQQAQTVFFIERLQPGWLPTGIYRLIYTLGERVIGGLIAGVIIGLSCGLIYGINQGLFLGLTAGLVAALFGSEPAEPSSPTREIRHSAQGAVLGGVLLSLGWLGLRNQAGYGLVGGIIGMLVGWVLGGPGLKPRTILVVEVFRWSWARALATAAIFGAISGLVAGVALGLLAGRNGLERGVMYGLAAGSGIGLAFGLVAGLRAGLVSSEVEHRTLPNQGIWRSARSALWCGLGGGLILALSFELIGRLVDAIVVCWLFESICWLFESIGGPIFGSNTWLYGLAGGVIAGLRYGGFACLRHLTLRLILWRRGAIPWNCARFLDYCAERIFLRKIGGGYIFVHRLLMEHFAALEPPAKEQHSELW